MYKLVISVVLAAGCCVQAASTLAAVAAPDVVIFRGMCDASGAIPLDYQRFMVADDEDNVLRVYDARKGGDPVETLVLTADALHISLPPVKPGKTPKLELDIEAATHLNNQSYWLTSHGRNSKGKVKAERFQFFGLQLDTATKQWTPIGKAYGGLVQALIQEPQFKPYKLGEAAERPAEEPQGLNVEGMTARAEGGVLIGLRTPIIQGKALVFGLLNPERILLGDAPKFLPPIELDLKGLGVRGLSSWQGAYLIAAGGAADAQAPALYTWKGGSDTPQRLDITLPDTFNPEAFFTPEGTPSFMMLSDDGARLVNGVACKKLKNPAQKTFRGIWLPIKS